MNPLKLMTHIVAGYPNLETSEQIAQVLLEAGSDILEIQIPFSDPIADGPVIAKANDDAIKAGAKVEDCLEMIGRVAASTDKSVLIMSYFNIVLHYGVEAFCKKAKEKGVQGLIIPDFPIDEEAGDHLMEMSRQHGLYLVPVVAPNSRDDRMKQVLKDAQGFVYCMARTGITGKTTTIDPSTLDYLKRVRSHTDLPIAVGFGISQKEQLKALEPHADIAVIGSALIRQYQEKSSEEAVKAVQEFLKSLLA